MRWSHARVRFVALAALLAFAAANVAVVSHAAHARDAERVAVAHDASAHRVNAGADAAGAVPHRVDCLACSWARSLRQRAAAVFLMAPAADAGVPVVIPVLAVRSPVRAAQPPLRSPPHPPALA